MKIIVLCLIISWGLVGCIGKNQKGSSNSNYKVSNEIKQKKESFSSNKLVEINLKKKYPVKNLYLQDLAEIEYIPLETRSDVLLDAGALNLGSFISDSLIITFNPEGSVFVFNRQGKNLHVFNHVGRSGEEYQKIVNMAVDFKSQEIYICDFWQKARICVYAFNGMFKRVLKLPYNYCLTGLFNFDSQSLLCYDIYDVIRSVEKEKINPRPYALISKTDGKITPLDFTLQERVSSTVDMGIGKEFVTWQIYPIMKNGGNFTVSEFACDTVYKLKGKQMSPFLVKRPSSSWKSEYPIVGYVVSQTNRYTFFTFMELKISESGEDNLYKQLVYDNSTGEICEYRLFNRDFEPAKELELTNFFCDLPENYVRCKLLPSILIENCKAGKLNGKLKEVASRLQEDANPVVMLIKFKE